MRDVHPPYVAISEIASPALGADTLIDAFRNRLHKVDVVQGFLGLEVLQDCRSPYRFLMITRWRAKSDFMRYMRSPEHRESHARIPSGSLRPRPAGFSEYELVAT
jgi:heme-degrading monooxygenase HmoA